MAEAVAGSTWQREFPLNSQASSHVFQTPPTVALGDFKRSIVTAAGTVGALTNLDNTPTVDPAGSAQVKIIVSASETTAAGPGGHINIIGVDASGDEWDSIFISVDVEEATTNARASNIQSRIPAALVGGRIDSNIGAISTDTTAADNAEAFFDGTGYAGTNNVIPTVTTLTNKTGFSLSAEGIQAIWDALTSALTTVGSIGKLLVDNINATITSRMATFTYTAPPAVADIADAIWDEATAGHTTAGTFGEQAKSDIDTLVTNVAAILLDTETDGVVVASGSKTGYTLANDQSSVTVGTVNDLGTTARSRVNTEVLDVLNVDTFAEPASVPAATSTLVAKLQWLFALARNKMTQSSTTQTLRNDADSASIGTSPVSDDGDTMTRGEWS